MAAIYSSRPWQPRGPSGGAPPAFSEEAARYGNTFRRVLESSSFTAGSAAGEAPPFQARVFDVATQSKEMAAHLDASYAQTAAGGSCRLAIPDSQLQDWMANGYVSDHTLSVFLGECNARGIDENQHVLSDTQDSLEQSLRDLEAQDGMIRTEEGELEKMVRQLEEDAKMAALTQRLIEKTLKEQAETREKNEANRKAAATSAVKVDKFTNQVTVWVKAKEFADSVFANWRDITGKITVGVAALYLAKKGGEVIYRKITGDNT
jgi:hypothetical protein